MGAEWNGPILEAEGLGKCYGRRCAVSGLDLAIGRGEFFGLLGPNGAGKTTTLGMLAGHIEPSAGLVRICGQPVRRRDPALRAKLGLVPQDLAFYPSLSARDNLRFFGALYGLAGARLKHRVVAVLELSGLVGREREPVAQYSGGMKRRLNIALGLLHEPEILILDEPTVGVDAQSRGLILETLQHLNGAGLTVIYSTHYMEEAQRLCRRVAIMDQGRVLALEAPRALVRAQAEGIIELELLEAVTPELRQSLARLPLRLLAATAESLRLATPEPERWITPLVEAAREAGHTVRGVHILEPGLEAVFLRLTGRQLRD